MDYCRAQRRAKLEDWFVVNKLGIKFSYWKDVKVGKRSLANEKLDLFKELTDEKKQYFLEQNSEKERINKWFDSQTLKSFKELLESFKVTKVNIADDLGFNPSTICNTINKMQINENAKGLLYYYFLDDNNKRNVFVPRKTTPKRKKIQVIESESQEEGGDEVVLSGEYFARDEMDSERFVGATDSEIESPKVDEIELDSENENKEVLSFNEPDEVEELKRKCNVWYELSQKTLTLLEKKNDELERLKYLIDLARLNKEDKK